MPIELAIVTPEREVFTGSVEGVVLPGSEGDFGVLPGHERFLAPLRIGEAEIRSAASTQWAAVSEGFAEVTDGRVVVLVDTCELADQIDVARAEKARDTAQARVDAVRSGVDETSDLARAEAALKRALARLQAAGRGR